MPALDDQCPQRPATASRRYQALHDAVAERVRAFINEAQAAASHMLAALFECELAYVNVDHPDFIGMQNAWHEHMAGRDARAARPGGAAASDSDSLGSGGGGGGGGEGGGREVGNGDGSGRALQQLSVHSRNRSATHAHARHHVRAFAQAPKWMPD